MEMKNSAVYSRIMLMALTIMICASFGRPVEPELEKALDQFYGRTTIGESGDKEWLLAADKIEDEYMFEAADLEDGDIHMKISYRDQIMHNGKQHYLVILNGHTFEHTHHEWQIVDYLLFNDIKCRQLVQHNRTESMDEIGYSTVELGNGQCAVEVLSSYHTNAWFRGFKSLILLKNNEIKQALTFDKWSTNVPKEICCIDEEFADNSCFCQDVTTQWGLDYSTEPPYDIILNEYHYEGTGINSMEQLEKLNKHIVKRYKYHDGKYEIVE